MYSTCLFCTKHLGDNDVLETLPIGRRVVFDSAKGRLWVVCRSCAKWNLVPFDTRLETIDACERIFTIPEHGSRLTTSGWPGSAKVSTWCGLVHRNARSLRPGGTVHSTDAGGAGRLRSQVPVLSPAWGSSSACTQSGLSLAAESQGCGSCRGMAGS